MLTKNFYSYMRGVLQNTTADFTLKNGSLQPSVVTYSSHIPPFAAMNKHVVNTNDPGVSFGIGTTPANATDYKLENSLSSTQLRVSVPSAVSFSRENTYDEYSVTFGVTNITTATITISEVGLIAAPQTAYPALVDRTVLDTPVTIPAGQSKQITYTIRFNYGDAV